ncbi:DUF7269 family protein [Haloarcula salina]|uniref:Uncharacterized protein n=1 Tax=Haloarcula salina TaxID=1429914 RepID=A0AA41KIU4_9EURY|nr:hypothetical protein [Haloarcula salina]MBV0903221.1 hypothetical protein [Haloarcula salina]
MRRRAVVVAGTVAVGLALVAVGAFLALAGAPRPRADGPGAFGAVVVLLGLCVAGWKLWRRPDGPAVSPAPWWEADEFVSDPPEAAPADQRISGTAMVEHVESAAARARDGAPIAESLDPVREPLRTALVDALVRGGRDPDDVRDDLTAGTWTDDPVAAAVLDEAVTPADRPFRARVRAWLFPEQAVRRRSARAMAAVGAATDEALPAVVGQRAPRSVPVLAPTVDDLRRAADGSLQRSVDGALTRREFAGAERERADGDRRADETGPVDRSESPTDVAGDWSDVGPEVSD